MPSLAEAMPTMMTGKGNGKYTMRTGLHRVPDNADDIDTDAELQMGYKRHLIRV